jgi:hypothetical protein
MSGGSQPSSTTVSQAFPYAPAMPYILQGLQDAAKIYSQGPSQYTPWSQVSGFTPYQQQAQQNILDYTNSNAARDLIGNTQGAVENQIMGGQNYSQPLTGYAQSGVNQYLGGNQLSNTGVLNQLAYGDTTNPYAESQVQSALGQLSNKFMAETLPGLRRAAIGSNTYGSSRNALAEGAAAGNLQSQMQEAANQINMGAYNTSEQNRLNALQQIAQQQGQSAQTGANLMNQSANTYLNNLQQGLANYKNALSMPLDMLNQQMQVGQAQQAQSQTELADATNRWNFNQNQGWDTLAKFKNLIDANANLGTTSASSSYAPPSNMIGQLAGGLLQAGSMAYGAYQNANANNPTPAGTINPVSDNGIASGVQLQGLGPQSSGPTNIQPLSGYK